MEIVVDVINNYYHYCFEELSAINCRYAWNIIIIYLFEHKFLHLYDIALADFLRNQNEPIPNSQFRNEELLD